MPLVFAAIVPHPPVAIPSVGKDQAKQIEKTVVALEKLEKDLYAAKPDIVIIISPHGEVNPEAFTVNISENMK